MDEKTPISLSDAVDIPDEYYSVVVPKMEIVKAIENAISEKKISIRKLAAQIGWKHPQVIRITSGENYNIDSLLKLLDALDLKIVIEKK